MTANIKSPIGNKTAHAVRTDATGSPGISPWEFAAYSTLLILFAVFYTQRICSVVFLEYDTGLISLGSDLLNRGGHIYRDLHTIILPGSYLWLAGLFRLFGATAATCQIATVATIAGCGILILCIARQLIKGWLVFLPPAIILVMGPYWAHFNSHHWDSLFLFLAFSLLLTIHSTRPEPSGKGFYAAGLLAGLSILCYQNQAVGTVSGSLAAAATIYARSMSAKKSLHCLAWLWAGVATIMSALAVYLLCNGTLAPMLACTVSFVLNNYSTVNAVSYGYSNVQDMIIAAQRFPLNLMAATSFGIIKCAPAAVAAGLAFYKLKGGSFRSALTRYPHIVILSALALGLWLGEFHKPDLRRLLWGCPLMFVLCFYFAECAKEKIAGTRWLINGAGLIVLAGLLINAKLFLSLHPADSREYATRRGTIRSTADLSILSKLNTVTRPDEKVLVYPYDTGLAFLAGTRFPSIYPMIQYQYHTDSQVQSVLDDLEKSRVRYAVWNLAVGNCTYSQLGLPNYVPVPKEKQLIENYLLKNYDFAGSYGNYRLMKRRDAR